VARHLAGILAGRAAVRAARDDVLTCSVQGLDARESLFLDVEAGLDASRHGVVDDSVVPEPSEYVALAVEQGEPQPA